MIFLITILAIAFIAGVLIYLGCIEAMQMFALGVLITLIIAIVFSVTTYIFEVLGMHGSFILSDLFLLKRFHMSTLPIIFSYVLMAISLGSLCRCAFTEVYKLFIANKGD